MLFLEEVSGRWLESLIYLLDVEHALRNFLVLQTLVESNVLIMNSHLSSRTRHAAPNCTFFGFANLGTEPKLEIVNTNLINMNRDLKERPDWEKWIFWTENIIFLTLTRPLRRKLLMRWFFRRFQGENPPPPLSFLMRIFWKISI